MANGAIFELAVLSIVLLSLCGWVPAYVVHRVTYRHQQQMKGE